MAATAKAARRELRRRAGMVPPPRPLARAAGASQVAVAGRHEHLAAPVQIADRDLALGHARERAATGLLGEPGGAPHGRDAVLTVGAVLAVVVVAPELALGLAASRGRVLAAPAAAQPGQPAHI